MIVFVTVARQDDCMRDYLSLWGRALQSRIQIAHYEDLVRLSSLAPATYILAALDQLDPNQFATLTRLHQTHAGLPGFRFVNDPSRTLRRFQLLETLHQRQLNDFRAIRATDDVSVLRLPIFFRGENNHDGALTPLLRTHWEVDGGVALISRRGWRLEDVLAIEFCNTRDESGIFRKYSAFFVGDHIIPRSLNQGRRWMMKHAGTEFSRAQALEELEYVRQNPHVDQLRRIRDLAGVEYGRIDYSVRNGRVQTWEINLKPTIGRGALRRSRKRVPRAIAPIREQVKETFYRQFEEALQALDPATVPSEAAMAPIVPPRPVAPVRKRALRLKKMLRPLWPHLARIRRWPMPFVDRVAVLVLAPLGRRVRTGMRVMMLLF